MFTLVFRVVVPGSFHPSQLRLEAQSKRSQGRVSLNHKAEHNSAIPAVRIAPFDHNPPQPRVSAPTFG